MVVQKNYPFRGIGKASRNIQKGEEITITYMNLLMPTFMRRKKIRENWYFDCFCIRYRRVCENNFCYLKCYDYAL